MNDKPVVWILADDRAGNVSQCLGVAETLGLGFIRKDIEYNCMAKLPNMLLGRGLLAVSGESKARIGAPWPDLLVAAGRRTAPIARFIKKESGGKTKLVQIMDPGSAGRDEFDLVCIPKHDGRSIGVNGMEILGAPHRVTEEKLSEARAHWSDRFADLPEPRISVIVGGATKNKSFTQEDGRALGRLVNERAQELGGSILVTTSRRTGEAAEALLDEIKVSSFQFKWGDEGENPYFGFLSCGDEIIVTGDSVSMCSEACATGKPVSIYAPDGMISDKHKRMVNSLVEGGYAHMLGEGSGAGKKLNSTQDIADRIKALLA